MRDIHLTTNSGRTATEWRRKRAFRYAVRKFEIEGKYWSCSFFLASLWTSRAARSINVREKVLDSIKYDLKYQSTHSSPVELNWGSRYMKSGMFEVSLVIENLGK